MGMSASQARLLNLQARQSNLEYQGQQINQERTILSQQCTTLYNSLLAMTVPTPPSTSDYTTIQYSGEDGATTFTIGTVKPHGEDQYVVEIKTTEIGDSLQQVHGSYSVDRAGVDMKGDYVTSTPEDGIPANEISQYYIETTVDGKKEVRKANTSDFEWDSTKSAYKLPGSIPDGTKYFKRGANSDGSWATSGTATLNNPNEGRPIVLGQEGLTFAEAKTQHPELQWDRYETAISNTYGGAKSSIDKEDFYIFVITDSQTGVLEVNFALKSDVDLDSDKFTNISKFSENGKYSVSKEVEGCHLNFDMQGRINTISIPSTKDENGEITSWRDITLIAETVTDNAAYQDAYNQYEYAQYEYDKKQQEINAKTEIIQQEDRNLELKLQRLDNERTQITTEIEAVEKVINENIEKSYKTFSG